MQRETKDAGAVHEGLKAAIRALQAAWNRGAPQEEVRPLIEAVQRATTEALAPPAR